MTDTETQADGPTRRTQRERRSEAEAKLVDSATQLIAENGIERTSLAQIGERAGFSRGIVNHHFGTKAELIKRLVSQSQRAFGEAVSRDVEGTGLEAVLAIVDAYLRGLARSEPVDRSFLVMWAEAAGAGRELRSLFIEGDRGFRSWVGDHVNRGIGDGSIRADVSPEGFGAGLVAQLRGLGLELLVDPGGFDINRLRDDLLALIAAALRPDGSPVEHRGRLDG